MSKWLFLPGLIQTIYYCVVFTVMPNYKDKWAYNDAVHEPFIMPIELLVGISLTIYCMWKSWLLIRIYQQRLVDVQSSVETFSPMWLKRAITLFSALMILWVVFEMYNQLITPLTYVDQFGFHLLFATIALWSGIQALSHIREPYPSVNWLQASEQADKLDSAVENFDAGTQINEIAGDIPANTANVDTHLIILAERLENELHSKQWFKRSKLSIREMAQELGTNESYVSRALNNHLNKNFNQLVNEARVNYAKQCLIQHPTNNVLDIAFDSGFASKASFNRWFKLCTGQSPSAWQAHKQQANTAA
jgi:AraC-like DNA-binding protein